jgi:hypothetical protein
MPRRSSGARLWLEPEEFDSRGKRQRYAGWVIRDGPRKRRTGCPPEDRAGAEKALADYLAEKHGKPSRKRDGDPAEIFVTMALAIYATDVAPGHDRPDETKQRILTLGEFLGTL